MAVPRPLVNVLAWIGAFYLVITAFVVVAAVSGITPDNGVTTAAVVAEADAPADLPKEEDPLGPTELEFAKLDGDQRCHTSLYFTSISLVGDPDWYVKAPEGEAYPIDYLFPGKKNQLARAIARLGAGDDVSLTRVLEATGEC